jgi:hypothetical protein
VITLEWDTVERSAWQKLLGLVRSGLQQSWSYGEALRAVGVPAHRAVVRDSDGRAVACLQVVERRLLGPIGVGILLRGPVWIDPGSRSWAEPIVLSEIGRRVRRSSLIWAPETQGQLAGRPLITGHSTSWLDLSSGPGTLRRRLATDWRAGSAPKAIDWLLDQNEAYRRGVGYRGPSREFLGRLARAARDARELLLLHAFERAEPVAGIMLLRHGVSATYEVGYVSPRGRELRATHLLLWHGVEHLIRQKALARSRRDRHRPLARHRPVQAGHGRYGRNAARHVSGPPLASVLGLGKTRDPQ